MTMGLKVSSKDGAHKQVRAVAGPDIRALCSKYGVAPPIEDVSPEVEVVTLDMFTTEESGARCSGADILVECMARTERVRLQRTANQVIYAPASSPFGGPFSGDGSTGLTTAPPDQQSTPGTPISGGMIMAEPAARLTPYIARGLAGSIAHYSRTLREPVTYKNYQSIREMLVTGEWTWHIPEETPEEQLDAVREAVDWAWAKIRGARPGWASLVEGMAVCIGYGFSLHEIVWARDERGAYPVKFAFMDPSTVERWLFDGAQREWLGAQFRAGGDAPLSWVLPAQGEDITDHRILRATIAGHGNNLEGVPPTRPIDTLITMKQLVLEIIASGAERFACPVLVVGQDPDAYKDRNIQTNEQQLDDLFDVAQYMLAKDVPALKKPAGAMIEYLSAKGIFPDLLPLVHYIDSAISATFSTQAMSLSHGSSHGSNALAQVQDNDFLRSIPYYARWIARPLEQIMCLMLKEQGIALDVYPSLHWSAPEQPAEPKQWIDTLSVLHALVKAGLPDQAIQSALQRLGLPPDTYTSTVDDPVEVVESPGDGEQDGQISEEVQ